MKEVRTILKLREALAREHGVIGLVPTMGAFHEGHLSLFRAARTECDVVVVSMFVNPAQFDEDEDFDRYPRAKERDCRLAEAAGVDYFFSPSVGEVYPPGFQTWIELEQLGARLEGEHRPGHFRAVATICCKLFNIVRPERAYFGAKDAQQAAVIERLVRDLDLEIAVRVVPTVRDTDGLALSSRNARLSIEDRVRALALPRALAAGAEAHHSGGDPVAAALLQLNGLEPDYVEVVEFGSRLVLAGAARVGSVRLIDNVVLAGENG